MCLLSGQLPNGQWVIINFVDPTTANWRAQEAVRRGYGGVFEWANYTDSTTNSIVDAMSDGLNGINKENQTTPKSAKPITLTEIATQARVIQNAPLAAGKYFALKQLVDANDIYAKTHVFRDSKAVLGEHRNIIKRLLFAILPQSNAESLFAKPKSLQLAEAYMARIAPTKLISKNEPYPPLSNSSYACSPRPAHHLSTPNHPCHHPMRR